MITAKDIKVKSFYRVETCSFDVDARVVLQAVGTVRDYDVRCGAMTVEWMEQRLKGEILHKVYSDIQAKLRDVLYDTKFKVMDGAEHIMTRYQAVDLIDQVFREVMDLIDEKMKVG